MNNKKKARLRRAGWSVGSTRDFLGLSREEATLLEMKFALSRSLRQRRAAMKLSQQDLAHRIGSSQSRVAKMEAADFNVSIDLLVRALLALGATRRDVGRAVGRKATRAA
ncbi:MAG: helix-turn-helix transcriptional regulator [Planctomycetota bacterium]|nr:helix-turn-helix transcriptional regulator [Planctomycetota bacterium]